MVKRGLTFNLAPIIYFNSQTPEWSWLSNFSPHPITDPHGVVWATAEHLFQAGKCTNATDRGLIHAAISPAEAKRLGRTVTLRPGWEEKKEEVMKRVLRWKFEQHPALAEQLARTQRPHHNLVHQAAWDKFWGDGGDGSGQNILGRLLEEVAEEMLKGVR